MHAGARVAGVPELLEMIILDISDLYTIIEARAVSKEFRDGINSSPRIQRKLYLREDLSISKTRWVGPDEFSRRFVISVRHLPYNPTHNMAQPLNGPGVRYIINPLIFKPVSDQIRSLHNPDRWFHRLKICKEPNDIMVDEMEFGSKTDSLGIYGNMFVTKPPVMSLIIDLGYERTWIMSRGHPIRVAVKKKAGIRFKDIFEALNKKMRFDAYEKASQCYVMHDFEREQACFVTEEACQLVES